MRISPIKVSQRFGKWTVIGATRATYGGRLRNLWDCECDCGTVRGMPQDALLSGKSTQCSDCSNREKAAMKPRLTHGQSETRLHNIWMQMRRRCEKPSCPDYPRYGGRGIAVCEAWLDFEPFHRWAETNGYADDLTLDREDNDGNYDPDNCRWVSRKAQNRNRRDNQRFEWRGKSLTLPEIAEVAGISPALLRQRVRRDGLSVEQALSKPLRASRATKGVSDVPRI